MKIRNDILEMNINEFKDYYLNNNYNENMFNKDGSLNHNYNSFKKTGLIAKVLEDNWDKCYHSHKLNIDLKRPNANIEINKVINCYNKNLGCSVYECPECHDFIFVGHTCKSRLCSSCGYKYKLERVENILETAYNCKHRQIVFTMPDILRDFFYYPFEEKIDLLYEAVNKTINSILNESYKKNKDGITKKYKSKTKYTPGFFAFLHTFGRDLKWNPHIHILIAEMKLSKDKSSKWEYFDFNALSFRFQKILLDLIIKKYGNDKCVKELVRNCFKNYKKGFYVYAEKKKFKSLKQSIEYVTRYCGRPAISENRILNYDGKNVTFCYNDHKDNSYHEVTVDTDTFIKLIIRHLVPHNYKIIRYYGFYRKKHPLHDKIKLLIDKSKRKFRKSLLKHQNSILLSFNRKPLYCPHCDILMDFVLKIT